MAKVIIFGTKDLAQLAKFYLDHDSVHEVVAFSVNKNYLTADTLFEGLPIIPFEDIEAQFPPEQYSFFAPLIGTRMNELRETVYNNIKDKGYTCVSYVSSKATVFNNRIGENCFILEDNTLQPFTNIGNNVVLWSGNHIGHHGLIKDHVFMTSHVVMSGHCIIENNCFLGVNSTIRDGVILAKGTLVGMASAVTKDTEEWGVYIGNPAKKLEGKISKDLF